MILFYRQFLLLVTILSTLATSSHCCWGFASANIPLDSPVYDSLDKLAGMGLVSSDIRGIRPYSRAEAARLLGEAEAAVSGAGGAASSFATELLADLRHRLAREITLADEGGNAPSFSFEPLAYGRLRYVYLDGAPRSYERPVHDPGGDGVFGIGAGLRLDNPYPFLFQQHGTEVTPLFPNNEGISYRQGSNFEFRFATEAYAGRAAALLVEPLFLTQDDNTVLRLNKGYVKLGGGGLELELGRDANWLGLGRRGAITLTNNAQNFDLIKLSSPEPIAVRYLGALKYTFIFSRFDQTGTGQSVRRPYFLATKLSVKPTANFEIGFNLGRQTGGPGVNNGVSDTLRGLVGGTGADNSNSLAGVEMRYRLSWLGNTELYGEFSGEDSALFWPIVESYVAGIFIPCLTPSGRDDLRVEYFLGNPILYTSGTFPEGYLYRGMPIGHSQGGAAQEFFVRYSHWLAARNTLALEYNYGSRGNMGRVEVDTAGNFSPTGTKQALERRSGLRAFWNLPLYGDLNVQLMSGGERVHNVDLIDGRNRTNWISSAEIHYRY